MGKSIWSLLLTGSIMLYFHINIAAQTYRTNLHKTVTPASGRSAIDSFIRHIQWRDKMPQNNRPCSYYEGMPADVQKFIDLVTKTRKETGDDFGLDVPDNIKKFREKDFATLAFNSRSLGVAMIFVDLAEGAYELTPDKKHYTETALCAQKVMDEMKPNCCATRDDFYRMIAKTCKRSDIEEYMKETPEIYHQAPSEFKGSNGRAGKKAGALLPKVSSDIGMSKLEEPTFDHQKAIDLLMQHEVVVNNTHELKSPDHRAIARDAVKNIKGSILAA